MSEPRELVCLSKAEQWLVKATTFDEVKHIRDTAEAARLYAKKRHLAKRIIVHAATIEVKAQRKLGQLLTLIDLATGAPGNQHTGKRVANRSQDATGPVRLRDIPISKSDSSRSQAIARLPAATFDRYINGCINSQQEPTTAALLRLAKQQTVQASVAADTVQHDRIIRDLRQPISAGRRFPTIYCDPPWPYDNQASRSATSNFYPTMSLEEIAALPIGELAAEKESVASLPGIYAAACLRARYST